MSEVVGVIEIARLGVPALAAIFSALTEMVTKCLGIISVVSVHASITDEVITGLDLRDGQVFPGQGKNQSLRTQICLCKIA